MQKSIQKAIQVVLFVKTGGDLGHCFQSPSATYGQRRPRYGVEVIKLFSCSNQLGMKLARLTNLKLLTFENSFLLNITEHENFSANEHENAN